jgi:hypothetical protein
MSLEHSTNGVPRITPPTKRTPAHKAMMQRRIDDVLRWRLRGASFRDVCKSVRELEKVAGSAWFVDSGGKALSRKSLERYRQKADKEMLLTRESNRERLIAYHLARREDLYHEARIKGELGTALAVLKDIATLRGLYPPSKVAPTNPEGDQSYEGGLADLGPLCVALRVAIERRRSELAEEATGKSAPGTIPGPPQ